MKKNNRGFTMVELLAAIVIVGVLAAIAVGAVSLLLNTAEKRYYESLEKTLTLGAESYYADHRSLLPKAIGDSRKVSLKTLVKEKYLENVVDYSKKDCTNSNLSYVKVYKYAKNKYSYTVYLNCPSYKIDEEKYNTELSVEFVFNYSTSNIEAAFVTAKMKASGDNKIASYKYTIYRDGKAVYTSDSIAAGNVSNLSKKLLLKKYVPGNIQIGLTLYDIRGNHKLFLSDKKAIYDDTVPKCGNVNPKIESWENATNASRKITVKCISDPVTCLQNSFAKTFTTDIETGYITIKGTNADGSGRGERTCPVTVMIDKSKPVCGSSTGSTVWTRSERTVSINCSDATSGCTSSSYSQTFKETAKDANISIKDKAGNSRSCPVNVYVDKTPPKCGAVTGNSTSWSNQNRTISVACSDEHSGCSKASVSQTFTASTKTANITISDNVGNTTECPVNVYLDQTPPTAPTAGDIGEVSGSSTTGTIKTEASGSTDSHSGVLEYRYLVTNSDTAPSNTDSRFTTSLDFTRSCGTSYYAWAIAVDNAGNISPVKALGSTQDGADKYSDWSACSKKCGGGTQKKTNSCALITTGLSQSCNTQSCCSSTTAGSWSGWGSCNRSCGGGTRTRSRGIYSAYDGSYCRSETQSGSCNTHSCCQVSYYAGRYCWGFAQANMGGGANWSNGKLQVCTGNGTGCVAATNSSCGKLGGTYWYFKYCP